MREMSGIIPGHPNDPGAASAKGLERSSGDRRGRHLAEADGRDVHRSILVSASRQASIAALSPALHEACCTGRSTEDITVAMPAAEVATWLKTIPCRACWRHRGPSVVWVAVLPPAIPYASRSALCSCATQRSATTPADARTALPFAVAAMA